MTSDTPEFWPRHIGPDGAAVSRMLDVLGYPSVDALIDAAVPETIRRESPMELPPPATEAEVLAELAELADANAPRVSMIGLGYSGTITPPVIQRNVVENPAWYTAYTPYQPEISQGRLEALLLFQTMIEDLTGLPVANASLLDEPTAAAEAMTVARRTTRNGDVFLVDADTHPQTLAVLQTRAEPVGITLRVVDLETEDLSAGSKIWDGAFGALFSYPGSTGAIRDLEPLIEAAKSHGLTTAVAADLLALTRLTPPGEFGADVVVGSAQRFGVPMGFGGPHAGYMAVRTGLERTLPGRLVGVSHDADGRPAYRLALQTREQHIRREKATSNICTAQVLLAVVSGLYAAYHGREGLERIADRVHALARVVGGAGEQFGLPPVSTTFFDTVTLAAPGRADDLVAAAREAGVDIREVDGDHVGVSVDETTTIDQVQVLLDALAKESGAGVVDAAALLAQLDADSPAMPSDLRRTSDFLTHAWFSAYRSETAMMRYLRRLSDYDLALDRTMIPLGSCTMKLNAAAEMQAITWPGYAGLHPFAPDDENTGTVELIRRLEQMLASATGYDAVTVQPNAGSQGEFSGLLAIRGYHAARGESERDVCLIPASAHGTNAASAVMAGMRVVVIGTDADGNVDLADLHAKLDEHSDRVAALMITYPSTHGVFEEHVREVCAAVHAVGGQVYVDGANMNALVGIAAPPEFGADVSHLNLHKTFCIPHGGGGPGVGPIGVRAHLAPFLPNHPLRADAGPAGRGYPDGGVGPVSGAPWGSAGVLPIPYAYMRMMGSEGLREATRVAILSANYLAARLSEHYPVLYTGEQGLVAHECILDLREITKETGVTVDDVAKRLMDYGFHAPTMSFPVAGTLMVEPTESEDLVELDRFVDAMVAIRQEIDQVARGEVDLEASALRNAPHTADAVISEAWDRPYSRETAGMPAPGQRWQKYWPPVSRIDGAAGDRNLVCSCPPPEAFGE